MPKDAQGHMIPGLHTPRLTVPADIERPFYVDVKDFDETGFGDTYDDEEIERIRESSRIAAGALDAIAAEIRPGITTDHIDRVGHEYMVSHGAYPSTLGYSGFQKSLCTSVNEVICHGIPDDTVLEEGDIVNVDVTAFKNGMHGDTNRTFLVGEVSQEARDLVDRTLEATLRGIRAAKPGRQVSVIGRTIEKYAKRFGYSSVREYTGHGVGRQFHSGLIIPHYDDPERFTDVIEENMVFTVEPMLTIGSPRWTTWKDGWTVVTADKSLTAQFEHTIVIHADGAEILTGSLVENS
ncbi:type I methionyl aminopeptidase [Pseudoclavibacter sp. CFCC 13611]|uniref:type I methionyl aminopeptidase n=1 Tax=Pseudoclavibacter sp. CFCC 13611 TaxID=2615178 RepID=UPI001300E5D7|nr:type I methionyl aminopeptidase [Pseudoclavibacter sp. CFCC 13611]KAB1663559.1 type I methionyl aminopeptidase [Pseudoclavibacter sp. CFCC 13611]